MKLSRLNPLELIHHIATRACSSQPPSQHSALRPRTGEETNRYRGKRSLRIPEKFDNVEMPDKYRLPIMPKVPSVLTQGNIKAPKQAREIWRMRGEEQVNNDLLLGQFAIVALNGGMLKHEHFEVLRMGISRNLDQKKTFAIYRVDAPYKPITSHGVGKKMGGGKGSIDHYGTPVKAGRIILEIGGKAQWEEVRPWLSQQAGKMPFDALAINADMLKNLREEEQRLVDTNTNPVTFEWIVRNNIMDCQRSLSKYDKMWFGNFVYRDRIKNKKWQTVIGSRYRGKK